MSKIAKYSATLFLTLLIATMATATLASTVLAQTDQAIVDLSVQGGIGGTTSPAPGQYTYEANTVISLLATPDANYKFLYWIINGAYAGEHNQPPIIFPQQYIDPTTIDNETGEGTLTNDTEITPHPPATPSTYDSLVVTQNPLAIICGFGYEFKYEAVFIYQGPEQPGVATVNLVAGAGGGTVNPSPGKYTFADGASFTMTATANSGYEFQYWQASSTDAPGHENTIIKDNPFTVTCGVGVTYNYEPVFAPTGTTTTTTETPWLLYGAIIILAIIAVIGIAAAVVFRGKSKPKQ